MFIYLSPADKATIIVTLETRLLQVRERYDEAVEVGDGHHADACRSLRNALYSAIRALEPERPCLPENR